METNANNPAALLIGQPENKIAGRRWSFGSRVSAQERVQFTSQLAMMTGAGVAVSGALKSVIKQCQRPAFRAPLEQVQEEVLGGSSLSGALSKHPDIFDAAYTATVAAGEASGRMQEVLTQLAELQRAELRLKRTIRGMLIYPILLTVVSFSVIMTLVVFVLPRFETIFEQYDLTLPLVTQLLMGIAGELRTRWWLWLPIFGGMVGGLIAARTTTAGRELVDKALVRTPGVRKATQTLIGARCCRLLGLLISAGVPLVDCLKLLRAAISNCLFQELTERLEDAVTNGRSLSEALENNEVLPSSAPEMIATAERTGRMGEVCTLMGEHYDEEGETLARQLVSVIEPLVTIVMGGVVATVVLAVMLPVFDIATLAQR